MRLKIFFHDNCFDGATSAALFAAFYRGARDPGVEVALQGVQHRRGDPFEGLALDGDDNACVDFRFSPDPRMTWWFDHHVSAFQPPELRAAFEADQSGQKFFDPASPSCSILLWRVLRERFGWRPDDPDGAWAELVRWADIIDAARFDSPAMAVELAEPALQIMTWLEHNRDASLTHRLIGALGRTPLAELAAEPWIQGPLQPLLAEHRGHIELIRRRAVRDGDVVFFDLADDAVVAHNKFIAYMLFPDAVYTVGITQSKERCKISIGSNPWAPERRTHNIAELCERYGGGGHPVVGAVSLPTEQIDRTRQIAGELRQILRQPAAAAAPRA
ncbi:MAG TPA: hypothetical protein VKZ63_19320 [Kofleriaceae bacterium]|nr:hypothetical protein [Kofleriaceae bacterium]